MKVPVSASSSVGEKDRVVFLCVPVTAVPEESASLHVFSSPCYPMCVCGNFESLHQNFERVTHS